MADDFRVPMLRIKAELWLCDGSSRLITLFSSPGESLMDLLESERRFIPAMEEDRFWVVSRAAVAVLWAETGDVACIEEDLPVVERMIEVRLVDSRQIEGSLRFIPSTAGNRTVDVLCDPCNWIVLYVGSRIAHISKSHVLFAREV